MKLGPLEIKLQEDWRGCLKWFHIQANLFLVSATAIYGYWDGAAEYLSKGWFHAGQIVLVVAIIFNALREKNGA